MWNLHFLSVFLSPYCPITQAHLTLSQTLLLHYSIGPFSVIVAIIPQYWRGPLRSGFAVTKWTNASGTCDSGRQSTQIAHLLTEPFQLLSSYSPDNIVREVWSWY